MLSPYKIGTPFFFVGMGKHHQDSYSVGVSCPKKLGDAIHPGSDQNWQKSDDVTNIHRGGVKIYERTFFLQVPYM